jgi:pyruvate/2-oxoglutarate dehydrogenase complex dihydrolipoamide acyltransferase (E2) component
MSIDRPRRTETRPIPASRRAVTAAMRAGRRIAPIHGLVSLDVTEARSRLDAGPEPLSFTAFVVACVGRAASAHPEVHAYRDWRGRLVLHHFVDVATIVEVIRSDGSFPLAHLIRDADVRSVADISAEIRRVKANPVATPSGARLERFPPLLRLPGAFRVMYAAMARSPRVRRIAGTVEVTAVGMFGGGDGFGINVPTVATLGIVVGGISERAVVVDGSLQVREVLDLTVTVDHNVVDGAPAARFVQDLRDLIESAKVLA